MTYSISGLDPSHFRHLVGRSDHELREHQVLRMPVTARRGYPCRITLEDAEIGSSVLLVNHVSHDVPNPYRASHAIFVGEGATKPAQVTEQIPPALACRILSLRAFDREGMMADAVLVQPGEADAAIRRLLADCEMAYIHAHYAVRGCFAAKVDRLR